MKIVNDLALFTVELVMLAGFGIWGWHVAAGPWRFVLAVAVPLAVACLWGAVVAPRAWRRLPDPYLFAAQLGLFLLSALALATAGHVVPAVVLAVVALAVVPLDRIYARRA